MTDLLIRSVPTDDVQRIDEQARRLGLSRNEYLKRQILQQARRNSSPITQEDVQTFSQLAQDLDDPEIMKDAWS
ncbi:MAG: antitoxin [Actinomycetaceae bacterium]|nr:antitoxin [Actinomycetaceae bacterium]